MAWTNRRRSISSKIGRTSPGIAIGHAVWTATLPTRVMSIVARGGLGTRSANGGGSAPPIWGTMNTIEPAVGRADAAGPGGAGDPLRHGRAGRIHHRVNTRRYFDLIERLLPVGLLAAPDPNPSDEAYQDWHVMPAQAGGLGIANPTATEYWLGILEPQRAGLKADLRIIARCWRGCAPAAT